MESSRPTSEGSVVQSAGVCDAASSDDHQQVQSQARSYECSFCKKGFSNAQALGGHMNIHRKDKAKLKKTAAAARLPPDSSRSVLSASSRITNKVKPLEFTSRQILGKDIKWSDIFRGNHIQQQQEVSSFPRLRNESQMAETMIQLPLFVETTANRVVDYSKPLGQQQVSTNWQEQVLLHSTNGAAGGGGSSSMSAGSLDLELRLGHSPSSLPAPESSTVTTGSFLKFF